MIEKSKFFEDKNVLLLFRDIEDIIKKLKLFENIKQQLYYNQRIQNKWNFLWYSL